MTPYCIVSSDFKVDLSRNVFHYPREHRRAFKRIDVTLRTYHAKPRDHVMQILKYDYTFFKM
jgi:hypothetical protein